LAQWDAGGQQRTQLVAQVNSDALLAQVASINARRTNAAAVL